eukprot:362846-Chlamydomonas_euryale.AAC.2
MHVSRAPALRPGNTTGDTCVLPQLHREDRSAAYCALATQGCSHRCSGGTGQPPTATPPPAEGRGGRRGRAAGAAMR